MPPGSLIVMGFYIRLCSAPRWDIEERMVSRLHGPALGSISFTTPWHPSEGR